MSDKKYKINSMEDFHDSRMLHTEFFAISLQQISDEKMLEDLNRIVSKNNGIKCFYFNNDNIKREGIIRSLMIRDKEALIITSIQDEIIKNFSEVNIEIGFDFLQKPPKK